MDFFLHIREEKWKKREIIEVECSDAEEPQARTKKGKVTNQGKERMQYFLTKKKTREMSMHRKVVEGQHQRNENNYVLSQHQEKN